MIVLGNKRKINTNSHLTGELEIIYFCMADAQKDTSAARERLPLIGFVAVFYFCLFLFVFKSCYITRSRVNSGIKSSQRPAEHQTHDFTGVLVAECGADNVWGAVSKSAAQSFRYTSLHTRPRNVVLS